MRVVCFYREGEDYSRSVSEWLEDFYRRTGRRIEVIDPDEDDDFCEKSDIWEFPTIAAIDVNGTVRMMWSGKQLPLIDDVNFYALD